MKWETLFEGYAEGGRPAWIDAGEIVRVDDLRPSQDDHLTRVVTRTGGWVLLKEAPEDVLKRLGAWGKETK